MNVITMRVPSARRICTSINHSLRSFDIDVKAYSSKPPMSSRKPPLIEHLPCPIEPTSDDRIWLVIPDKADITDILESTFLNEQFVCSLIPKGKHSTEWMFALECMVAACSARKVAMAYNGKAATQKLYKAAHAEGTNQARQHLAEHVLCIPSLLELMLEFVDKLLAESGLAPQLSPAT